MYRISYFKKKTLTQLLIKRIYLEPSGLSKKNDILSFLSFDIINLSNFPILITSAEVNQLSQIKKLDRQGVTIGENTFDYKVENNEPIYLKPGETKNISISNGFLFKNFMYFLNKNKLMNLQISKLGKDRYIVHDLSIVEKLNTYMKEKYPDLIFEVRIYSGYKDLVYKKNFTFSSGSDLFDNSGKVSWDYFLGTFIHLHRTYPYLFEER
ncbi:hypothetical protein [Aliarcobacter butzleri]|uniref:hypothetical protein n=1 Tax=Aliarcobacter butzleri TaxID=28197 RepID=UPI00214B1270|nr:hypothetical protein [Aliarcobacter butzleri]MCP3649047.1 hypothetical protein [Arcobacter sp. DNRA7]MCR1815221.1 hypothetical protein [Aliarcobacter butzleri]